MRDCLLEHRPHNAVPLVPVTEKNLGAWLEAQPDAVRRWLESAGFAAKTGSFCLVPADNRGLAMVVVGVGSADDPWALGGMPSVLPKGCYYLDADWEARQQERAALGWALGAYQFTRYKEARALGAELAVTLESRLGGVRQQAQAIALVRDLINTPAEDMMPEHLFDAAVALGHEFSATVRQTVGDELLQRNFPVIHAVGRASVHAPRLIDLGWGDVRAPRVTLVGKGVCFDSGGLDLKNANNMRLMKKDMGGAAHALGLARLVMGEQLPVRLRVLIPAVENAVSGNAFRPGDVIRSRKGLTIEIDNTDAEGRLILCDALTEAVSENPDLVIDFSTLTGAARVALGADVPAMFCNHDDVAAGLLACAEEERDPLWRLPLHRPYREMLDSRVADIANASAAPYGGAITAALFLQEFIPNHTPWTHFDLMGWNTRSRPGRPEGGEAMGLRAVFRYLRQRYAA
ncbi:MAG: leucyl aminopeptidase family protein [Gammaproteobacteria bacterium]